MRVLGGTISAELLPKEFAAFKPSSTSTNPKITGAKALSPADRVRVRFSVQMGFRPNAELADARRDRKW